MVPCEHFHRSSEVLPLFEKVVASLPLKVRVLLLAEPLEVVLNQKVREACDCVEHATLDQSLDLLIRRQLCQLHEDASVHLLLVCQNYVHGVEDLHVKTALARDCEREAQHRRDQLDSLSHDLGSEKVLYFDELILQEAH